VKRILALLLPLTPVALAAQFPAAEYASRRAAAAAKLPTGAVMVLRAAPEPQHDYLEFYQSPAMLYLTGIREANSALVLARRGDAVVATVFVQPRDPAVEVWSGKRIGLDGAASVSGAPARLVSDLDAVVDSLGRAGARVVSDTEPTGRRIVEQLRGRKSPAELELIRRAVEITNEAHREAMRAARPGVHEYELEAAIEYVFRRNGAERPGFASIVGSGPNSTTLHYNANDRRTEPGDMVVMDVGASYMGYSADVTRTIPLNGVYGAEQRAIYQVVRAAQAAAERNAKPGMRSRAMLDSATAVIAQGLARLGLIESPTATYDARNPDGSTRQAPQVGLFFYHGLGHGIGLEVHDPEQYYETGIIAEGSAFTIEPGVYVRENLLDLLADTPRNRSLIAKLRPLLPRYRNIGVRIEDDYIVTAGGLEWISRAPREIEEIEALMRRATP
jgi:Xaa-Pro aminopeptidase